MNEVSPIISYRTLRSNSLGNSERDARINLAAMYRLMAVYGMTDLSGNHITARVPGTKDQILINAFGMLYEEVTASSLYKIDLDGKVLEQPDVPYGINPAGYVIHSAIHGVRHDVDCVVHTHTRAGVAVSCMKQGLMPLNQTAMIISDDLAYHDFEGPAVDLGERERLVADLGTKNNMVLRNHGLLCCGRSIPEAFYLIYQLENACRIQVDLMRSGAEIVAPSETATHNQAACMADLRKSPWGNREWPSLLRKLDRLLPGYDQ